MRSRRLKEVLRLRRRPEIIGAGLLIAVSCWYFGDDIWHAILLGCAIMVTALAVLVGASALGARDLSWAPGGRARSKGSRTDIARLSSSLHGDWGFVGGTAQRQLQQVARRRLSIEGLDLNNAERRSAIEHRIGADAYRVLVSSRGQPPKLKALVNCLDSLDAIDSTQHAEARPRTRRWDLRGIPFSVGRARER